MAAVRQIGMLETVRATVAATLRIEAEQLDVDARFDSFGIDSIISMELMTNLSKALGISLTPTQFLNVGTIRELADYIDANCSVAGRVDDLSAAQVASDGDVEGESVDFESLRAFVKDKYSIDPGPDGFATIDELVESLIATNLEPLLAHYDLFDGDEPDSAVSRTSPSNDIAIVGIGCRFPDASDPQRFWENLVDRRNSVRELRDSRWVREAIDANSSDAPPSRWGALVEGVELFDAEFFGISAKDSCLIDPQERLLCEEVYKAFQDAGVDTGKLAGSRTGVFVGYEYAEYEQRLRAQPEVLAGAPPLSSSSPAYYLANRISYLFDLRGPSESINVNCASSALAINRAYHSLLTRESDLAVASGVSLNLFSDDYIALAQHGLLSPDGTCGVFDNDANGYTRGEGVAAIVLKRVEDARRDNDRIYAVIKACHQNNRGHANTMSTIRHESITEVIGECYKKAGVASDSVSYIELNGYSKRWGDSFEFEGIRNVFEARGERTKHCALGSLKGNVGHLEPASGIASVIKVAMSLWNEQFPPTITRRTLNEFIDLDSKAHPLYFADAPIPFASVRKDASTPVRAGVNSFCDSGANVHILLEEGPHIGRLQAEDGTIPCRLFVLSARNPDRLDDYIDEFVRFLSHEHATIPFANLLYTLQARREAMDERLAIIAAGPDELIEKLKKAKAAGPERRPQLEQQGVYFGNAKGREGSSLLKLVNGGLTEQIIEQALQKQQWQEIALLWINGAQIDWPKIWQQRSVQPVSLPGYPFARERHWLEFAEASTEDPNARRPAAAASPASNDSAPDARTNICADPQRFREPPRNDLERRLAAVWAEVLNIAPEQIGIHDNFFELGGNSLLATQAVSRMRSQIEVNLPLIAFLNVSTIAGTAEVVASINYQGADMLDDNDEEVFEEGSLGSSEDEAGGESSIDSQLAAFNDTQADFPEHKCIHELFAEQAAKHPDRIAVDHEGEQLTYQQLYEQSGELALYLQSLGVKPDRLVALCLDRSPRMLVGILGILQAGGAYVPLDPNYPDSRLEYMLRDCNATLVLTQQSMEGRLKALVADGARLIALDSQRQSISDHAAALRTQHVELRREVGPHHLAYVIYTSGSTGTPKGVMVEHRGVVNLVTWHRNTFLPDTPATTSSTAGVGFDACAWEVHSALCAGATLLLPPPATAQDPAQLIRWWSTRPITSSFLVTALAEQVVSQGVSNSQLSAILMGGDRARAAIPADLPFDVINNYGPTEITVVATSGVCEKGRRVDNIGRPIANTRIYILDANRQMLPLGAAGEIYIGGVGVARGYLHRPDLTQERFLIDPFCNEPGARMYRSGDLGRWQADGTIEFLGRNDSQVKIRGFRIELGEIEAQLTTHARVRDAVVLAREDVPGDPRLVAFVTTHDEGGVDELRAQLRAHLQKNLPDYMVPDAFVRLDALPVTANGKVDRRELEQREVPRESGESYVAPRNETEAQLTRIWAQLLHLDADRVGVNDNFFELGGNSLSATQLISKIRSEFETELSLQALFNCNTVAHVAEAVMAIRRQHAWAPDELDLPDLELEDGSL